MSDLPNGPAGNTCYACDQAATTKEHAPPRSFFPEGGRGLNLIKVPSCKVHNCDISLDVEYVRNSIVSAAGLNERGELLIDAAKRSFDHSPKLLERTFESFTDHSREEQVGTYQFNLERVDKVMTAVAQALHYRDLGQKWSCRLVFVPSLKSEWSLIHKTHDGWDGVRDLFGSVSYINRPTADPKVFMYGSQAVDGGWAYRLTFYGALSSTRS